ncbi:MAG: hypothetical protein HZA28_01065 [Candidatus Omnitrophica bacterium]|nr:hypothetical protein [Candidatus Omnitrophota bacterium]
MKRVLMLSVGAGVGAGVIALFIASGYVMAQEALTAETTVTVTAPAAATADVLAAKKAGLNNTEWTIELKPMGVAKAKSEKDTLLFSDGKVSSANLEKAGYGTTNFSARILEDNETLTWETMQTSEKNGVAFWRGDIGPDNVMRGVLSKRDLKNNTKDFNFVSTGSREAAPVAAPAPAEK